MRLEGTSAPCGGAIIAGANGEGFVTVDASQGGTLLVLDATELDSSQGCLNIQANLVDEETGKTIQQPCSGCAGPSFPPARRTACQCAHQMPNTSVGECCTA